MNPIKPPRKTLVLIVLVALLAFTVYRKQLELESDKRAVIIDQLYSENREYGFSDRCSTLLEAEGYSVRLCRGENVSVDFLRDSKWSMDIIVLRMHSGVFDNFTWLFTHEPYSSKKHVTEQLTGEINIGVCPSVDYHVFTVSSRFIGVNAVLDGGLVLVMGCSGLEKNDLGEALMESGAGAVIGWDGPVTVEETDKAVLSLLMEILDGKTIGEAVGAQEQLSSGVRLGFYPSYSGDYKLG